MARDSNKWRVVYSKNMVEEPDLEPFVETQQAYARPAALSLVRGSKFRQLKPFDI